MLRIKPPTHRIDAPGTYICGRDPAWDNAKNDAHLAAFVERARKEKQDAAEADYRAGHKDREVTDAEIETVRAGVELTPAEHKAAIELHPVVRYYSGATRLQPNAPDWGPDGAPITVRDYLKPGSKPTEFQIRRLSLRDFQAICEIDNTRARLLEAARAGLRAIRSEGYEWTARGDEWASDAQLEAIHEADPELVPELGAAVLSLCRPLSDAETFR
jgi:hypothetical protein